MICNVCNIDKPEKEYQQYWHSTQQKFHTRKECNTCFYGKRKAKKMGIEFVPVQPVRMIRCTGCKKEKPETEYNFNSIARNVTRCNLCREKSARYNTDKQDREQEILDTLGGLEYCRYPNEYKNEIQKKAVFDIMLSMGWKFNEEGGIWFKEGIKTPQGVFLNIRPYLYGRKEHFKTPELIEELKQMVNDGYTYKQICEKYKLGYDLLVRWIGKKKKNI